MPEDDPGRLLGRVVDGGDGVVHERHLHVAVAGAAARRDAVAAPARRAGRSRARPIGVQRRGPIRAGAWGRARTKRAFRPRAPPRRRSWNSSALPVKTGSVRSLSPAWLCGSGVQRVQRPPARRARTWACGVPAAQTRPSRSKRRGACAQHRGRAPAGGGGLDARCVEGQLGQGAARTEASPPLGLRLVRGGGEAGREGAARQALGRSPAPSGARPGGG